MWIDFIISPEGTPPGPILNDTIYYEIENDQETFLGKDLFLISEKMWDSLYEWHGGGPCLKWKINVMEPSADEISYRPSQLMPEAL
jgi:hypothetical protein